MLSRYREGMVQVSAPVNPPLKLLLPPVLISSPLLCGR